jgi:hypothetical protein
VKNQSSQRRLSFAFLSSVSTLFVALIVAQSASADWNIDFSRRTKSNRDQDLSTTQAAAGDDRAPASVRAHDTGVGANPSTDPGSGLTENQQQGKGLFDTIFDAGEPVQEIVILNTEHGFVPGMVRVRKGGRYKISVVNVNEKEKNVSFILDGFSEHHATYYGKVKTFMLEPKKEGIYSFISPETAAEGKLTVFNPQVSVRAPASESGK